ncbi:transcriptional regulator [Microtetraspora sp. NBRC 13810]|uniref:helix-turn-helix domain-containing protein n=1 Tax=Microtetraspora sp. NBRC 13810 TaxID=3030990 RepID=UPI0025558ADB|nr:helix-turn-helix transcriptional regulator [Microtetraspora sp. NBRC 13810]GLW10106.1 transcriptional regulator [Microtetraspora sp. NBRC 13810]
MGRELRTLRDSKGLSLEEVAKTVGWSASKLSRIETAHTRPAPGALGDLLALYQVAPERVDELEQLARDARRRRWWASYGDAFTGPFVALEDEATTIRSWQPQLIPGLLQTEAYARAVIQASWPDADAADVERRVAARMARRAILDRRDAPKLHAVLDEMAVRRQVATAAVRREQIGALLALSRRTNITLQIMPFSAGIHAGLEGHFVILGFPECDPDVAYVESVAGDTFEDSPDRVSKIESRFERIVGASLSPADTRDFLSRLVKE